MVVVPRRGAGAGAEHCAQETVWREQKIESREQVFGTHNALPPGGLAVEVVSGSIVFRNLCYTDFNLLPPISIFTRQTTAQKIVGWHLAQ